MTSTLTSTYSTLALIGDERRGARSGRVIDVVNPSDNTVFAQIPRMDASDVEDAYAAAAKAFPGWARLEPHVRAGYLMRFAAAIEARGDELAMLDALDNGSPVHEMAFDITVTAAHLRYFAGLAIQLQGTTVPSAPERLLYSLKQPFGVTGRIGAFNHPLMFTVAKMGPVLAAGNTLVTKPSEHTSLSALAVADIIQEIFPPGVVNILTGYGHEVGDAIVSHPDIRRLAFIGAAETGRAIQRRAAEVAVKNVSLELGGKNPIVIFPDADLELAVEGAVRGMNFTWQGQSCGSTSRLLVHESIHREFIEKLAERIDAITPGLPTDPSSDTGAIVTPQQMKKVLDYVEIGKAEGAELVVGGTRVTDGALAEGNFIRPALFDNVDPNGRLAQEEIFGPVLAAMPFTDYDDALRIANGIRYGLTASAFTRDLATAHRFGRDAQAGFVWINETSRHFLGAGFGGFKDSGVGREESFEELVSWSQNKTVSVLFE
jgi:acyl-CoA reductase-like NAD-dependent aldehyde dehydrogenase